MYSFDAAIRGYHQYSKYWYPEVNQKLYLSHKRDNAFDVFSIKTWDKEGRIVGQLPMEVSIITKFLMDRGVKLTETLRITNYRKSPLTQGDLEIPCSVDVYMMSSTVLSRKLIQGIPSWQKISTWSPLMTVVLVRSLRLLFSIEGQD